jgi:small subunit ribosomal protein S6
MAKPNVAGSAHAYELCVIFDASLDDKKAILLIEKYLEIITDDGGTIEKIDTLGRRKFEYEINKKTEGVYVIVNFTCTSDTTNELVRRLALDKSTLRHKLFRS